MPAEIDDHSQEFIAYRRRGRPLLRWTDKVVSEAVNPYNEAWSIAPLVNEFIQPRRIVPFFHLSSETWW